MSKKSVEKLFDSLYRLTDMREVFRKTSPTHELSEEQKEEIKRIIEDVEGNLEAIKEDMVE